MGLRRGKYMYVKVEDRKYVKVRVFKGRADSNPDKYVIVGKPVRRIPPTAKIIDIKELPDEVARKIASELYGFYE
ncbi:MAG: cren protein [Thermoprotei archaeon]|nr:MAG: cren protein [Thermoprotei archaeon]